jgi:hypothetical protein
MHRVIWDTGLRAALGRFNLKLIESFEVTMLIASQPMAETEMEQGYPSKTL